MLINTIPIIEFNEFKSNKKKFNSAIGVCVNLEQLQSDEAIQLFLNSNSQHFICIDLHEKYNLNKINLLDIIRILVSLSFNFNYYKINNVPIIAILNNNEKTKEVIVEIKNEFIKQGYEDLLLFELNENNNSFSVISNCFFSNKEINKAELERFVELFYSEEIIDKIYFVYSTLVKLRLIIEQIINAEKLFAKNEYKLYSVFESIQKLKSENKSLYDENILLNTRIQNADINLKLLRKDADYIIKWHKEEINKIKEWYNIQYEVLPLWYKKMGHVVKKFLKQRVPKVKK